MQNPIIYENKVLNYKGKTIFNKLVLGTFKRIPKYFQEEEACFMFVDNASIIMRTPDKTIRFESGETMRAKCGNYD